MKNDNKTPTLDRRGFLKASVATGLAASSPFFIHNAFAKGETFRNAPKADAKTITLGFNVPQTGAYADEGADELRAFKLAVKHLKGESDGGMMNTFKPSALKGNAVLCKKAAFVTGDTHTK